MLFKFISDKKDLIKLSDLIKSDNDICGCKIPKKLKQNEYIISFIDIKTNEIASFIWFGIYDNVLIDKHINTNFSYTFKKFRSNGLNKKLRLTIEEFALTININKITSIPLNNSPSLNILINLGYTLNDNFYLKNIC